LVVDLAVRAVIFDLLVLMRWVHVKMEVVFVKIVVLGEVLNFSMS
jgi:hypothetical protein